MDDFSDEEPASLSLQPLKVPVISELDILIKDISQTIGCLYRVSIHLNQRSTKQRDGKVASIDVSLFEDYDTEYLREKFPSLQDFLIVRLVKAISRRRQYLTYRNLHAKKLHSNIDADHNTDVQSVLTQTTATTFRSAGGSEEPFGAVRASFTPSLMSDTTYASIAANGDSTSMPDVPKDALEGKAFECPICRKINQLDDNKPVQDWYRHVFRDLRPYICTFEDCATPDTDYDSRHQWFNHEKKVHRVSWNCRGHCSSSFQSLIVFQEHVIKFKPMGIDTRQLSTFIDMCSVPMRELTEVQCPFCQEIVVGTKYTEKHIGHHLEQVALFALPRSMFNDDDVEESDDDQESNESEVSVHEILDSKVPDASVPDDNKPPDEMLEDLLRSVEDWKGHDPSSFGELIRYGVYWVSRKDRKGPQARFYNVYLFRRIMIFCKEYKKSSKVLGRNKKPALQLKGRIFMTNIKDVRPCEETQLPAILVLWEADAGIIEDFIIRFTQASTRDDWYCKILDCRGILGPPLTAVKDPAGRCRHDQTVRRQVNAEEAIEQWEDAIRQAHRENPRPLYPDVDVWTTGMFENPRHAPAISPPQSKALTPGDQPLIGPPQVMSARSSEAQVHEPPQVHERRAIIDGESVAFRIPTRAHDGRAMPDDESDTSVERTRLREKTPPIRRTR